MELKSSQRTGFLLGANQHPTFGCLIPCHLMCIEEDEPGVVIAAIEMHFMFEHIATLSHLVRFALQDGDIAILDSLKETKLRLFRLCQTSRGLLFTHFYIHQPQQNKDGGIKHGRRQILSY